LTSMVLQNDFKMFFGSDGSTYVTLFCELADLVLQMSQSNNQENVRIHAAQFLLHSGKIFKARIEDCGRSNQPCELSIHMKYGLVQVMNAALVLLQDENAEIRQKAVAFVSIHLNNNQAICRVMAMQVLTRFGLDYFEDCAEHFLPITQLSQVDWNLLDQKSSQLFESGDGINVFNEEAFADGLYCQILLDWLEDLNEERTPMFRFLNCPHLMERAIQFKEALEKASDKDEVFGTIVSPKGFGNAVKILYLLQIVAKCPSLLNDHLSTENCRQIQEICEMLRQTLRM